MIDFKPLALIFVYLEDYHTDNRLSHRQPFSKHDPIPAAAQAARRVSARRAKTVPAEATGHFLHQAAHEALHQVLAGHACPHDAIGAYGDAPSPNAQVPHVALAWAPCADCPVQFVRCCLVAEYAAADIEHMLHAASLALLEHLRHVHAGHKLDDQPEGRHAALAAEQGIAQARLPENGNRHARAASMRQAFGASGRDDCNPNP